MESAEINSTIIENNSIQVLSLSNRAVARAGSGSSVSQSEIRSVNETTIEDNDSNSGSDLRPSSGVFAGPQTERGAGGGGGTISTVSPIPETESIQIDDDEEKIDGVSPVSHEENDTELQFVEATTHVEVESSVVPPPSSDTIATRLMMLTIFV